MEEGTSGAWAWASEHPFLTFFIVTAAVSGIVTILRPSSAKDGLTSTKGLPEDSEDRYARLILPPG
jgi:hypothetical protein